MNDCDGMQPVYLDHAATSPLRPISQQAMDANAGLVGNPAALHGGGRVARALLEDCREELAALSGAHPEEVIFTSGGSEADAIAVVGSTSLNKDHRKRIIISGFEHPAVNGIQHTHGSQVDCVRIDRGGHLDPEHFTRLLEENRACGVALVSVMMVNNEVGTIQPIVELAEQAHRANSWFHTDAVQGFGHCEVDFSQSGADLLSLSAHKIGGPTGIGALLIRRGIQIPAYGLGGRQEGGIRSGTQSAVLAAGFAAAARQMTAERKAESARLAGLRAQLVDCALAIPGSRVNGIEPVSPAVVNIGFAGASAADVMFLLDQRQIWCSTGSACRAGVQGPSEVLAAMGQDYRAAREGVRFSLGWTTTNDDIDRLTAVLPEVIAQARRVPR